MNKYEEEQIDVLYKKYIYTSDYDKLIHEHIVDNIETLTLTQTTTTAPTNNVEASGDPLAKTCQILIPNLLAQTLLPYE